MGVLITPISPMNHDAVKEAAARFFRHVRRCGKCDLLSEHLCKTGGRLRDEKYQAVSQKWRR